MWDIEYQILNNQVIAILTLESGFVVDDGSTKYGTEVNYLIYTATEGEPPSQPIIKSTPFHLDINAKPLEIQIMEGGVKRKIKKTRDNVSDQKHMKK